MPSLEQPAPRRPPLGRTWALALCARWLCACTTGEPECEVRVAAAALTNSARAAEYLKLESWQLDAVVQVYVAGVPACSGVLVADRAALTARHCLRDAEPTEVVVAFGPAMDELVFQTPAHVVAAHPELDVLVLELDQSAGEAIGAAPLPVARALPSGLKAGSLVQLGGFGHDTEGAGRRGFLVEAVTEIGSEQISVTAEGLGGACFGDSGGPLLSRAEGGYPHTLALLGSGTASCFGTDSYTRLDTLIEWFEREAPIALDADPSVMLGESYPTLGHEGRCFDDNAVWFEDGRLRVTTCKEGRACAWNDKAAGYRCYGAGKDPCRGLGDVGICEDGAAVRCNRGQIDRNPCAACGFTCARSPKTGGPICMPSERDH